MRQTEIIPFELGRRPIFFYSPLFFFFFFLFSFFLFFLFFSFSSSFLLFLSPFFLSFFVYGMDRQLRARGERHANIKRAVAAASISRKNFAGRM